MNENTDIVRQYLFRPFGLPINRQLFLVEQGISIKSF